MVDNQECNSRNIPLPIQREVRQRCGFGCVICGMPLYEYEHMNEWAEVKRHVADEITLLCDKHHREKTGGLLPKQVVFEANKRPFNLNENVSKPYDLYYSGDIAEVYIGNNGFSCQNQGYGTVLYPLVIDNIPLIGFVLADDHLLLNLVIFDEFNLPVLQIRNNQLFYSISAWDIQLVGTVLTVREAERKILVEIKFDPPNRVSITRGRFLLNGVEVIIRKDEIKVTGGPTLKNMRLNGFNGGLVIGQNDLGIQALFTKPRMNRYNQQASEKN